MSGATEDRFGELVDAVRIGTVLAHDPKAARRWARRKTRHGRPEGLTGVALEQAVMSLSMTNPEYVVGA